jgi:hypothetical protein
LMKPSKCFLKVESLAAEVATIGFEG